MVSRRIIAFLILAASLIGALVTGRSLFYNLLYLWATVILIAAVWTWAGLRGIRLSRHKPSAHAPYLNQPFIAPRALDPVSASGLPGNSSYRRAIE